MKKADEIVDRTASTNTPRTEDTTANPQTRVVQKTDPAILLLSSPSERAEPNERGQRAHRRATGPRTELGKQRSSQNAIKHGIFLDGTVLKGESHAKYRSLLRELWEALLPEGKLEEILVEKLATNLLRHRRLLAAEGAEIRKNVEFLAWDQRNQQQEAAQQIGNSDFLEYDGGLIRKIRNPDVLERCLELLAELREKIEAHGLDLDRDTPILKKLYGARDKGHLRETLYDTYFIWLSTAEASEEVRQREGSAIPDHCKRIVLNRIDAEIRRLKRYHKTLTAMEADRTKLETLRRSVPDSPVLAHISILNSTYEPSEARRHQYLCGFERDEDAPEVHTQWVRIKTVRFSSLSTPL